MKTSQILAASLVVLLTACGGGGGGSNTPQLTLNTTALSLGSSADSSGGPTAEIVGRISGTPSSVFLTILHTANGIASVSIPSVNGSTGTSTVQMRGGSSLGHGRYTDTITVNACADAGCARHFAGSPAQIAVTYMVGIPATPASLSFSMVEGGTAPVAQALQFSHRNASAAWTAQPTYTGGSRTGWLSATPATGTGMPASTSLRASTLPVGSYSAELRLGVGGEQRALPVQYQVLSLLDAGFPQPLTITNANGGATAGIQSTVVARDGRTVVWTADLPQGPEWLSLARTGGNTGTSDVLRVEVAPAAIRQVANGSYDTLVRLRADAAGAAPLLLPLRVVLDRSVVGAAAPYAEAAGRAGTVIVSGDRLAELGEPQEVRIGGTLANSVVREAGSGPAQYRVAYPALPAGRHAVTLRAGNRDLPSVATLELVDDADYVGAGVGAPVLANGILWLPGLFDPAARSLYAGPTVGFSGPLTALRREPSGWVEQRSAQSYPGLLGAGFSRGGRLIVALTENRDVLEIDAATLEQISSTPALLANVSLYVGSPHTNQDGDLIIPAGDRLHRYRPGAGRRELTDQAVGQTLPTLAASAAGNRMLAYTPISEGAPLLLVDPAALTAAPFLTSAPFSTTDVLGDRFGERWALVGEPSHGDSVVNVYDRSGTLLGRIDTEGDFYTGRALNRDGTRLYLGFGERRRGAAPSSTPVLEVYDLSAEPVMGQFPLLRSLPLGSLRIGTLGLAPDESEILLTDGSTVSALPLDAEPQTPPATP